MVNEKFNAIVVGAGPSGNAAACTFFEPGCSPRSSSRTFG